MKAVISVLGKDKVGIIHKVSGILAKSNVNILDINQTIMQGIFTMITLVDISNMNVDFTELSDMLAKEGENLGLSIKIQHEDIFNSMHRI